MHWPKFYVRRLTNVASLKSHKLNNWNGLQTRIFKAKAKALNALNTE